MTTTSTTGVTLVQAAELLWAHLADHQLSEPAALTVRIRRAGCSEVNAQVGSSPVPDVAVELLLWTHTLTTVTVQVWRVPAGDRVHLSIGSTLTGPAGAVELEVFGGADYDPVIFADLAPGESRSASVGELSRWAASGSGAAGGGEVA